MTESLRAYYLAHYEPLRLAGKSSNTKRLYANTLNNFDRYLGREAKLLDLNDDTVAAYLGWIVGRGRAVPTANKERSQLVALASYAFRKHAIAEMLDVLPLTEPSRIPKAWTRGELQKLFAACRRLDGTLCDVPASRWWYALHSVLWWTGERIGAVMRLRWDAVDFESGWLVVPAELRKGKRRDKGFLLPAESVKALRAITNPVRTLIFPWPFNPTHIYFRYKKLLEAAGLPTDRKSKFHRMRKSTASHFEAAGGNATKLLDHTSRRVTENYLDPRIVGGQNTSDFLFKPDEELKL